MDLQDAVAELEALPLRSLVALLRRVERRVGECPVERHLSNAVCGRVQVDRILGKWEAWLHSTPTLIVLLPKLSRFLENYEKGKYKW